jgi:hypothetical protein
LIRSYRNTALCLLVLAAAGVAQERPQARQTVRIGVVPPKTVEATVSSTSTSRRISEGTDQRKERAVRQPNHTAQTTKVVTITD